MKTIKEILDNLGEQDKRLLMLAFEHQLGQLVKLPENKFIGVNVNVRQFSGISIENQVGVWAYGTINENHSLRSSSASG